MRILATVTFIGLDFTTAVYISSYKRWVTRVTQHSRRLFRCGWTDGVNPLGAERGNQSYWTKRIYTSWREVFPGLRGTVLFCDNTNLITQLLSPAPAVALLFLLPHYTKLQSTFSQPPTSSHFLAKLRRFLQFHQLVFFLRSTFMELKVYDDVRFLSSSSLNVNK